MDAGLSGPLRPLNPTASAAAPRAGEAIAAPAESGEARLRKRRAQDEDSEHDGQKRRRQQPSPAAEDVPAAAAPPPAPGLLVDPALSEHVEQAPSGAGMRAYHEKLASGGAAVSHRVEKLA